MQAHRWVSPLFVSAEFGHAPVTFALLSAINLKFDDTEPAADDHVVLSSVADSARTSDGATPLFVAAKGGHMKVAVILLENGANANLAVRSGSTNSEFGGLTPLTVAAARGDSDLVRLLVERGAIDSPPYPALRAAQEAGDAKTIALLRKK